jgi:uncharacterized damage-inducible protein DinB
MMPVPTPPRALRRRALRAVGAALLLAAPLAAQSPVTADMGPDLEQLKRKYVALAEAMPESRYDWRPGDGVRSVAELFKHVISDNYLLPAMGGATPPSASGIRGDDYNTAVAYERRAMTKAEIQAELAASFDFLAEAMRGVTAQSLADPIDMFGRASTRQGLLYLTMGHLHEHLGQAIAYARINEVVPPWSRRQ